jgi:hypothetical protein
MTDIWDKDLPDIKINKHVEEYPCSNCARAGCVIWLKYIRKTPPVTDDEHEENQRLMLIFKDVLSNTGCRHQINKKNKYGEL